jgi:hypothetical protein
MNATATPFRCPGAGRAGVVRPGAPGFRRLPGRVLRHDPRGVHVGPAPVQRLVPPPFWKGCPACGHRQLSTRSCTRCNLRQRLQVLLADRDGDVRVELRGLHDNLANSERSNLMLAWLNKTAITRILDEFGTGQRALSHAALDSSRPANRSSTCAPSWSPPTPCRPVMNTWPARRLDRTRPHRTRRSRAAATVHRDAIWHLLRRLRHRINAAHATHAQVVTVQRHVRAAIALLDGLGTRSRALADARQADLDAWLTSGQARHRREAGHFVRWARRQKLTSLEFPATRWHGQPAPSTPRPAGHKPDCCCTRAR